VYDIVPYVYYTLYKVAIGGFFFFRIICHMRRLVARAEREAEAAAWVSKDRMA